MNAELSALIGRIQDALHISEPTQTVTSTELAVPGLAKRAATGFVPSKETTWLADQLQGAADAFNAKLGIYDSRVTLPRLQTLEERIMPLLGHDFSLLQRLYELIEGARYKQFVRRKNPKTGRSKLHLVEFGPNWVKPIRLLEAGETLDTVELVYLARAQFPDCSIELLLDILHNYAWDDSEVFARFLEEIESLYWGLAPGSRLSFFGALLHQIDESYYGSLEDWLDTRFFQDRQLNVLLRMSNELPLSRMGRQQLKRYDTDWSAFFENADRDFFARTKLRQIGGTFCG